MGVATATIQAARNALPRMQGRSVTRTPTIDAYFAAELDKAIAEEEIRSGYPASEWMTAGPKGGHDRKWWLSNGPGLIRNFTDWYDSNDDVSVWVTPDGRPAIELELLVNFGAIPVRMFIDLVLQIGTALVVVDLKSGAKTPESLSQLAIYSCGVELAYGKQYRPRYGSFFMLRGSGRSAEDRKYFLQPSDLSGYQHSVPWWTRQFELFDQAVRQGIFIANPTEGCKRCGVARACPAVGGKLATVFDPSLLEGKGNWLN